MNSLTDELTTILNWCKENCHLDSLEVEFYDRDHTVIKLYQIIVDKNWRKMGFGSKAMRCLVAFADTFNLKIILSLACKDDNIGTTSRSRLAKFYKEFGFVENKGRNKDFRYRESMYRNPR